MSSWTRDRHIDLTKGDTNIRADKQRGRQKYVCREMDKDVCLCLCVCTHACDACTFVCMRACVFMCVCVCVSVCVCVRNDP
jgi:hypothetical protein